MTSDDIFTPLDYALFNDTMAYVYDDNENLVRLTFEDSEDDESLDETSKDLANRVFFFLYTKDNPSRPQPLYLDNDNALRKSNFNPEKPTRLITHGWMNSGDSSACTLIRDGTLINATRKRTVPFLAFPPAPAPEISPRVMHRR